MIFSFDISFLKLCVSIFLPLFYHKKSYNKSPADSGAFVYYYFPPEAGQPLADVFILFPARRRVSAKGPCLPAGRASLPGLANPAEAGGAGWLAQ